MTRTTTRLLLIVLAAAAVIGVFAIHRIESAGSPVGKPSATPRFSPNGDGVLDVATVTARLRQPGSFSAWIEDGRGRRVRTLQRRRQMPKGPISRSWDGLDERRGDVAADGRYVVALRFDGRVFRLPRHVLLDTRAPTVGTPRAHATGPRPGHVTIDFTTTEPITSRWILKDDVRLAVTAKSSVVRSDGSIRWRYVARLRRGPDGSRGSASGRLFTIRVTDAVGNTTDQDVTASTAAPGRLR